MKKVIIVFLFAICFAFTGSVKAAAATTVVLDVQGKMEAGENFNIIVNVNNIDSFYAGAASFKYDPKIIKVLDIEKGDFISDKKFNTFDASNKIDNTIGTATFGGFTCLGNVKGYSGSGTFIIIKAQLLKKESFHIKSQPFLTAPNDDYNLKLQLCNSDVKEVSYDFTGYDLKVTSAGKSEVTTPIVQGGSTDSTGSKSSPSAPGNASNSASSTSTNSLANNSKGTNSSSSSKTVAKAETNAASVTKAVENKNKNTKELSNINKSKKYPYILAGLVILLLIILGGYGYYRNKKYKFRKNS